jgi:hypothetical protein
MESLKKLILDNLLNYPELSEYDKVMIDLILSQEKKRPDISIEGCKSLIEGISKFLYFNLNKNNLNLVSWKKLYFKDKFEKAIASLELDGYEKEFLEKNSALILNLGQIRNDRGDIAHGQAYPKDHYSETYFQKFIALWTEGLCYFLLSSYIISKQKVDDGTYTQEQFEEFDHYLETSRPEIQISYSKALKEQDPLQYETLLEDYINKIEKDKEDEQN